MDAAACNTTTAATCMPQSTPRDQRPETTTFAAHTGGSSNAKIAANMTGAKSHSNNEVASATTTR